MKIKFRIGLSVVLSFLAVLSCDDYVIEEFTSDDTLIGQYIEQDENYSEFLKMLETTGYISFLKAYGTYTCMAPTNDAVNKYLSEKGVSSVDQLDAEELKKVVKYHIMKDTLSSTTFNDGKLNSPTMYGQYLTVGAYFENEGLVLKINKETKINQPDIRNANGIIHSIDDVLEPIKLSIAELIEQKEEYSLFTEALKVTGLYDTLKQVPFGDLYNDGDSVRWFTVLAHSNETFAKDNINSIEDLKTRYSNTSNPREPKDSLYLYMAYHILDHSLKYVSDIIQEASHLTLAPLEAITIKVKSDSVLLNEAVFFGEFEKGAPINREQSDNTAANGVFHDVTENIYIKIRRPQRVYFDVANQPEIRSIPGVYRVLGMFATLSLGQLEDITWSTDIDITYETSAQGAKEYNGLLYNDFLSIPLRKKKINWIEFKTPLLVKGDYKVWICTRNVWEGRRPKFQVVFNDGDPMANIIDNNITMDRTISNDEYLLSGWKRPVFNLADSATYFSHPHGVLCGQLAGTINVPTTAQHTIRLDVINDGDGGLWIDHIQFIPVDEDQIWPMIDAEGKLIDKPDWFE